MSGALALRRPGADATPRPADPSLGALLATVSWPELRANPWRNLTALFAVMLGVALAFSVQLINESALSEFSAAVRSVNGQADVELRPAYRGVAGGFDESLYARVAAHPRVALASPVAEGDTYAVGADGRRVALHVLGIDALVAGALNPASLPQPFARDDRLALLDPDALFLNAAARQALGVAEVPKTPGTPGTSGTAGSASASASASTAPPSPQRSVRMQTPEGTVTLRLAGSVALGGAPSRRSPPCSPPSRGPSCAPTRGVT